MPSGNDAVVVEPQSGQTLVSHRCSVTSRQGSGISRTCRRWYENVFSRRKDRPQRPQADTAWFTISSGVSTIFNVVPRCPTWPPRGRSLLGRTGRLTRLYPSLDGGLLLFWLFWFKRSSSFWMRTSMSLLAVINAMSKSAACSGLFRQKSINCSRVCSSILNYIRY